MSGIVSVKENKEGNILKQLFRKESWVKKYFVLKGQRVYIYSTDTYDNLNQIQ